MIATGGKDRFCTKTVSHTVDPTSAEASSRVKAAQVIPRYKLGWRWVPLRSEQSGRRPQLCSSAAVAASARLYAFSAST